MGLSGGGSHDQMASPGLVRKPDTVDTMARLPRSARSRSTIAAVAW